MKKVFKVVLIRPSHYDDNGYPIQWFKSWIPTNSLSVVHGILFDAVRNGALGDNVDVQIEAFDEQHTVLPIKKLIASIQCGAGGVVMMVGVQTNQFPRAVDLARPFREAGIGVMIGGFHVSGVVAMVPDWKAGLGAAEELGISLFAGELEGHAEEVLQDAYAGRLKPLYNVLASPPDLESAPMPFLAPEALRRMSKHAVTGLDLGRGCPFSCSFCTIINVQGRKPRCRSVEKVVDFFHMTSSFGLFRYFIADDNFARNRNWEKFLDALIELREKEGVEIEFFIQVDTKAAKIPRFIEKCKKAGCNRVFIGMESVRQENLEGVSKTQNKVEELQEMALAWKKAGILTYGTMIIGFPNDTPQTVKEDVLFIKEKLPLDFVEFFMMVPAPGSEDHRQMLQEGVEIDDDFNRYDTEHVTMNHPKMSGEEWQEVYRDAWKTYYTDDYLEKSLKSAYENGIPIHDILATYMAFYGSVQFEGLHPLQYGLVRRKVRRSRRPGLPTESPFTFYPQRLWETVTTQLKFALYYLHIEKIKRRVLKELGK